MYDIKYNIGKCLLDKQLPSNVWKNIRAYYGKMKKAAIHSSSDANKIVIVIVKL